MWASIGVCALNFGRLNLEYALKYLENVCPKKWYEEQYEGLFSNLSFYRYLDDWDLIHTFLWNIVLTSSSTRTGYKGPNKTCIESSTYNNFIQMEAKEY